MFISGILFPSHSSFTQLELYVSISVALNYEVYVAKAYFQDETEYPIQI